MEDVNSKSVVQNIYWVISDYFAGGIVNISTIEMFTSSQCFWRMFLSVTEHWKDQLVAELFIYYIHVCDESYVHLASTWLRQYYKYM